MKKDKPKIMVLGNPQPHPSSEAFLIKFIKIISNLSREVQVVSGDKPPLYHNVSWIKTRNWENSNFFKRLINFLRIQLQIISISWKNKDKFDLVIILPTSYILPLIFFKIMKKRVGLFVDGKPSKTLLNLAKINFIFSDIIIAESENIIREWGISGHEKKIYKGSMYVDINFSMEKTINNRKNIVGFVGRLSEEKGILNLIYAIPDILKYDPTLKFLIAGQGELSSEVERYIKVNNLNNSVRFIDWIPHSNLPHCLNELKLFVLPSFSEGLPNIILESMACGTPILANAVGGIPDIIKNEKTGFLMDDNKSKNISQTLIKVINKEKLIEDVSINAIQLIKDEYQYESSLERYKIIVNHLRE